MNALYNHLTVSQNLMKTRIVVNNAEVKNPFIRWVLSTLVLLILLIAALLLLPFIGLGIGIGIGFLSLSLGILSIRYWISRRRYEQYLHNSPTNTTIGSLPPSSKKETDDDYNP